MEETVLLQSAGHIATLRLNRPQTFNALDEESLKLLLEKVNAVAADPEIRVLIVGSTSPKSFAFRCRYRSNAAQLPCAVGAIL